MTGGTLLAISGLGVGLLLLLDGSAKASTATTSTTSPPPAPSPGTPAVYTPPPASAPPATPASSPASEMTSDGWDALIREGYTSGAADFCNGAAQGTSAAPAVFSYTDSTGLSHNVSMTDAMRSQWQAGYNNGWITYSSGASSCAGAAGVSTAGIFGFGKEYPKVFRQKAPFSLVSAR